MNLILLFPSDFQDDQTVCLTGRRFTHLKEIIKPKVDDVLTVGLVDGDWGQGVVTQITQSDITMTVQLHQKPPQDLPIILCMALIRPLVFKRVLSTATALGVKNFIFFHSRQVEKSFWQSTALNEKNIKEHLVLGLEQAKDTKMPQVIFQKKFKPFLENVLLPLSLKHPVIVADPSGKKLDAKIRQKIFPAKPIVLVFGPEGGFIPYEINLFQKHRFSIVNMGERILKVETAMTSLISKLFDY